MADKREVGRQVEHTGKNNPVYWRDPSIGVDEYRECPANWRFTREPTLEHYHGKEYWYVGNVPLKMSNEMIVKGVIFVSNDNNHGFLSMTEDHWKENEFEGPKKQQSRLESPPVQPIEVKKVRTPNPVLPVEQVVYVATNYHHARKEKGLRPQKPQPSRHR